MRTETIKSKKISLGIFASKEGFLKVFPQFNAAKLVFTGDDTGFYFSAFVYSEDLENYILVNEEHLKELKAMIQMQQDFFAQLKDAASIKMEEMRADEVYVCLHRSLEEAREEMGFKTLRAGNCQDVWLVETCDDEAKITHVGPRAPFFAKKEEVLGYMVQLQEKIRENCESRFYMELFIQNLKDLFKG